MKKNLHKLKGKMKMCKPKISLFSLSYSLNLSGSSGPSESDYTKKGPLKTFSLKRKRKKNKNPWRRMKLQRILWPNNNKRS